MHFNSDYQIILKIINKTTLKTIPNYDSFKEKIIAGFKSGKGLTGKDGIFSVNGEGCFRKTLSEELNQCF